MRPFFLLLLLVFVAACAQEKTLDQYLAESESYIAAGDYAAARIELRNALQIDSNSAAARYMLGQMHFNTDANADAEKELLRAEEYGWSNDAIRPMLAKALLNQGKLYELSELDIENLQPTAAGKVLSVQVLGALLDDEAATALKLFDRAKDTAPEDIDVRLLEARMAALQGDLEGALQQADVLLQAEPHNADVLRLRAHILLRQERLQEARDAFARTIEDATVDFADRVARATINLRLGQFDAVAEDLDAVSELAPGHPDVRYIAGLMAFYEGRDRDALANLDRALPAASRYPLTLFYLSLAQLLEGDPVVAEIHAREFVQLVPDSVQGRKLLALLLLQNKDFEEVEEVLQPVRDYNPSDIGALHLVAHALIPIDRGHEALFLFRRLGRLLPDDDISQLPFTEGLVVSSLDAHREGAIQAALDPPEPFPREEILQIYRLLEAGENDMAVAAADSLKWRMPADLAPYSILADAYLAAGQEDEAREILLLALKRDPGNAAANLRLAQMARQDGDNTAERAYYRAALAYDRGNVPVLMSLAYLEDTEGDDYAMRGTLREAIDLNPQALEPRLGLARYYLNSERPERVAPLFKGLLRLQQGSPRVMELNAMADMALGNYEAAYQTFSKLIRKTGGTAEQYHMLAMSASALGDKRAAHAALKAGIELSPDNTTLLLAKALLHESEGDIDGMAPYVDRLAKLSPTTPEVLRLIAVGAAHSGDVGGALNLAQIAHHHAPSTTTVLQVAQYQRQSGEPDLARETLLAWLEDNPEDVPALLSLSDQLHSEGDAAAAEEYYARVLEVDPENVLALNNLAWLLRDSQPRRALTNIRRASKLMPEEPMVLDSRAVIEHINGENVRAAKAIEKALELMPGNPSMLYHQAMILAAMGEQERAHAQLQRVLRDNPEPFEGRGEATALLSSLEEALAQNQP